jgi:hypothetical protein
MLSAFLLQRRMIRPINTDSERMWVQAVMALFVVRTRYTHGETDENPKNLSQGSRSADCCEIETSDRPTECERRVSPNTTLML